MATVIGIIKTLIGTAVATGTNGSQRTLQAGDRIFQDEVITTGPAGAVEVEFSDGSVMTLGRNSQAVLDNEAFSPQDIAQPTVDADVEALQQALLEGGDLSQIADATAAGAGTSGESNEGVDIVQILHEAPEVTPDAGFETMGVNVAFEDAIEEDAIVDDVPVVSADHVSTDEDTVVSINVLDNDELGANGGSVTAYTEPSNGTVILNADGSFSYTPAANFSGEDSFTYTVTDGDGDSATATATVNVTAVADAPNLIISVGEAVVHSAPQTIDISNVSTTDNGFEVTAYDIFGNETSVSTTSGTNHDGFGVDGWSSGASSEIGSNNNSSERLKVEFDNTVSSVGVNFAWLSSIETAAYTFYLDGIQVGSTDTVSYQSDTVDGVFVLSPGVEFDRIDFTAPLNYTDDYLVNLITFDKVTSYSYELNVVTSLTDVDGSETSSDVTISSLPNGVSLTGTTLTSDTPLTAEQLNQITGSVTSTEASVDATPKTATTVSTTKVEFAGSDASAETADLLIEGDALANSLLGGSGDDIIFGGAGNDVLTGGAGEDEFVWNSSDVGTVAMPAHDTVMDFDDTDDVLNLSDLLSDGSHTIEGINNGSGDLQLNIKDSANNTVQEIELTGVSISGDAVAAMQSLLASGAINDGI
ncbi:hypothetical protein A9Q92_01050 [Methylophaga sp. 42_8_T64]|nr:hypothetical protein A9Q92_01050 [Methylophaga sp. 42_8_T64]